MVIVSWNDALAYCKLLNEREGLKRYDGYRLPTEAEWEYACRAGTTSRYQFGDDPETLALVGNIADGTLKAEYPNWKWPTIAARDGFINTAPVGQFRPNAFNLYDMHGNVWEWCQDGYDGNYYGQSPGADPAGPLGASGRVFRGGGWNAGPRFRRSAPGAGSLRGAGTSAWGSAWPESSLVVELRSGSGAPERRLEGARGRSPCPDGNNDGQSGEEHQTTLG